MFQPIAYQFAISVSSSQLCTVRASMISLSSTTLFWTIIVGMCREVVSCRGRLQCWGCIWDWKTGCFRCVAAYSIMVCYVQNTTPVYKSVLVSTGTVCWRTVSMCSGLQFHPPPHPHAHTQVINLWALSMEQSRRMGSFWEPQWPILETGLW